MKLNLTFLFVITVFSFGLLSCSSSEQAQVTNNNTIQSETPAAIIPDNNTPKPKIVFESKLLELGKIGPETRASGEFIFTNKGNAVLEIKNVSQCCGFTVSYKKSIYEPGEKGSIKVSYTPSKQPGKLAKYYIVSSNDPIDPNITLLVTVEIENKVVVKPESLKLFLDEENAACPKLTVSSTDEQPFMVRGVRSTGNCITAQFDSDLKATQITLDLKADIAKLKQNKRGYVEIVVTHPEMSIVTLPFDVLSRFSVHPTKLTALNTDPGVPVVRKLYVYNNYSQKFEIESISSKNNYITVLSQGKSNDGYQFEIQIMPPPSEGKTYFYDELYIQVKNNEKLKIDCEGFYNPPKTE